MTHKKGSVLKGRVYLTSVLESVKGKGNKKGGGIDEIHEREWEKLCMIFSVLIFRWLWCHLANISKTYLSVFSIDRFSILACYCYFHLDIIWCYESFYFPIVSDDSGKYGAKLNCTETKTYYSWLFSSSVSPLFKAEK